MYIDLVYIFYILDHPTILPKSIPDLNVAQVNAKDYLFMGCIQFIHEVLSIRKVDS